MKTWTRTRSPGRLAGLAGRAGQSARSSRLALCLGLALATGLAIETTSGPSFAQSAANPPGAPSPAAKGAAVSSSQENGSGDSADRLAKRRERLQQGAKRLRDRAAEIRQRIAKGEKSPPAAPNSKRPPRSLEEQARRFEEQADKMDQRSKTLSEDSPGVERNPELARQRRHQLRRSHLNRRWGAATLRDPEAAAEFKVHAARVARLKRIRSLAMEKSKDDPVAKRAKDLLTKEEERHEQHMKSIQARVAPAAASAPTPAEPAAEPAASPEEESK